MVFPLHSVHQDASFELSKSTIGHFLFLTIRGDPIDFGGVRALRAGKDLSKMVFKVSFSDLMAFTMQIFVRPKDFCGFQFKYPPFL